MKLAHIFESTERGISGGNTPNGTMSMEDAETKLKAHADEDGCYFFDDIESKDHHDVMVVVRVGNVDHQKPTTSNRYNAETPEDLNGYHEAEWEMDAYAESSDEDGEFWTIHDGTVELSERGNKQLDDLVHEATLNDVNNRDQHEY